MIVTYTDKTYRITYDAVSMIENALDNPNLIQISVISGCTIMVAPNEYGITYLPNGEYQQWQLSGVNTALKKTDEHYLYARLRRTEKDALLVFSINNYEFDGKIIEKADSNPSEDYYYVKIGKITATNTLENATLKRELSYDGGYLNTPQGSQEDALGWKKMFVLTTENLINPLKHFTSFAIEGTLSIIGAFVLNKKRISNISKNEDEEFVIDDESITTTKYIHNKYIETLRDILLNKDRDDTMNGHLTLKKGITADLIQSSKYSEGTLGFGHFLKYNPKTGRSRLEIDEMYVRLKAIFDSLEIKESKHISGQEIITGASIKCTKVEVISKENLYDSDGKRLKDLDDKYLFSSLSETVYRCYFTSDDGTKAISSEFVAGDFAHYRQFNIKKGVYQNVSNRYYWRYVVGVGDNYIDLSTSNCDPISDIPEVGDNIIQLGNLNDATRQNAIILSAVGVNSPCKQMLQGINSYSLADKIVIEEGFDHETNQAYTKIFGRSYIGDKNRNSCIEFDPYTGLKILGAEIDISADKFTVNDKDGNQIAVFKTDTTGKPVLKAENIDAENLIIKKLKGATGSVNSLNIEGSRAEGTSFRGIHYESNDLPTEFFDLNPDMFRDIPNNLANSSLQANVLLMLSRARNNTYDRVLYAEGVSEFYGNVLIGKGNKNGSVSKLAALVADSLWCRGEFGHRKMTTMELNSDSNVNFYAHIYGSGIDTEYYKYAQPGQPIDCLVLKGNGNYVLRICESDMYKMVVVINDSNASKRVVINQASSITVDIPSWSYKIFITADIVTNSNPQQVCNLFSQ